LEKRIEERRKIHQELLESAVENHKKAKSFLKVFCAENIHQTAKERCSV